MPNITANAIKKVFSDHFSSVDRNYTKKSPYKKTIVPFKKFLKNFIEPLSGEQELAKGQKSELCKFLLLHENPRTPCEQGFIKKLVDLVGQQTINVIRSEVSKLANPYGFFLSGHFCSPDPRSRAFILARLSLEEKEEKREKPNTELIEMLNSWSSLGLKLYLQELLMPRIRYCYWYAAENDIKPIEDVRDDMRRLSLGL